MNYTRFLGLLARQAGGWEEFTDPVELTSAQFARILRDPQVNAGDTGLTPHDGRLRIIRNGIRQGQSLDTVQKLLTDARQPRLYSRNSREAAVVYLLSLNQDLSNTLFMPKKELVELRQQWLEKLQQAAGAAMQAQLSPEIPEAEAIGKQHQAQAAIRLAIQQGRCSYRDLTDYVQEAFRQDGSTYVVTASVSGAMNQIIQEVRQQLPALQDAAQVEACLLRNWEAFLKDSAPAFVRSRLTATNYLVRTLVRALDPFYTALARVTAELSSARYPKNESLIRLRDILFGQDLIIGENGCEAWFEYPAVLTALFSQDRTAAAEESLRTELMEKEAWYDLSDPLRPFFYFFGQDAPRALMPDKRLALAKENWARQPLHLSGVARLLLGMLDPGYDVKDEEWARKRAEQKAQKKARAQARKEAQALEAAAAEAGGKTAQAAAAEAGSGTAGAAQAQTPAPEQAGAKDKPREQGKGKTDSPTPEIPAHQQVMAELFSQSGSYLARVLQGEADLDRNMFLLFLLLSEDLCARQLPRREQMAPRLSGAGKEYTDILNRCGLNPLEDFLPFDAALKAALAADLPAAPRKTLFLKALQVCEETARDPRAGRKALAADASEYTGHLAAIDAVFTRLNAGTHAPLAGLHD